MTTTALPVRRNFGWRPDTPDQRDHVFDHRKVIRRKGARVLLKPIDLRPLQLHVPVLDQDNLGSCVWNSGGKAFEFTQRKQGLEDFLCSRLFGYWNTRQIEGTINVDAGCEIRDAMKVLTKLGAPHEALWPYDIARFTEKPPQAAYTDGLKHQALEYQSVEVKTTAVKAALAAGFPIIVGFTVYTSFYQLENKSERGFMRVPKPSESVEGGHAVLVMGWGRMKAPWDKYAKDYAIVLNSWGEDWADGGFFYMPLAWLCNRNNADDFWTLTGVEA